MRQSEGFSNAPEMCGKEEEESGKEGGWEDWLGSGEVIELLTEKQGIKVLCN